MLLIQLITHMENQSYYFSLEVMRKQAAEKTACLSKGRIINLLENEFEPQWTKNDGVVHTGLATKIKDGILEVEVDDNLEKVTLGDLMAESLMWLADIIE